MLFLQFFFIYSRKSIYNIQIGLDDAEANKIVCSFLMELWVFFRDNFRYKNDKNEFVANTDLRLNWKIELVKYFGIYHWLLLLLLYNQNS